jgi:toxin HigB-1
MNLAGQRSRRLAQDIQPLSRRKLRMLNNARSLDDLRIPPANWLERLKRDRAGKYSIRINDQWRICFVERELSPQRLVHHRDNWYSTDTALRLARYFGTSEAFWMGLQADYDLEEARERLGDRLEHEVRSHAA